MSNKLTGKSNKKQNVEEQSGAGIAKNLIEYLISVMCIALSILIPLYLKDGYHGVGDCKYEAYKWVMIISVSLIGFFALLYLVMSSGKMNIKFGLTEYLCIAFLALVFLSSVGSGYFKECMTGYSGWYIGFFVLASFMFLMFVVKNGGTFYKSTIGIMLGTAFITFAIAILHRLMIDVIGTYGLGTAAEIEDKYKNQFLSTLGQASWYSGFLCTVLPLGIAFFCFSEKMMIRILSGIFVGAGFMSLVTQNSDSAYFALIGFFFVFFWYCIVDAKKMERFLLLFVLFMVSTRLMKLLFMVHPNPILELDPIGNIIINNNSMWIVTIVAFVFWGIAYFYGKADKQMYPVEIMKKVRLVALGLLMFVLLAAVVILVWGTKGTLPDALVKMTEKVPYLVWYDNWGNGRGRTWAFTVQMYKDMDIWHKLFGAGPDGYAHYAYALYEDRLADMWANRTLTNAHNEWLNAFINYGLFGAVAYIGIFISVFCTIIKKWKNESILCGIIACVVSYMCHNFFCYQTVCCTPFIFMIMGIGLYICQKSEKNTEQFK